MNRVIVSWALVVCLLILRTVNADSPELVGDLGAPDRIVFNGQETFSEQQLRDAVTGNLKLIVASHPHAKFDDYVNQLKNHLESGYRHAGFPNVTMTVNHDSARDAIIVAISEGARYVSGKIEITGASNVPAERIRENLARGQLPNLSFLSKEARDVVQKRNESRKDSGLWIVGKPASFSDAYFRQLKTSISKCYEQFGYYKSDVGFNVRPEGDGTATLVVSINADGPQAVVRHIEISGNKKNSHDDMIGFLGLTRGMPLNSLVTESIRNRLRTSARFVKYKVEVTHATDEEGVSDLKVTVVENPKAPKLTRELSSVEQAALRVGEWIENLSYGNDDFLGEIRCTINDESATNAEGKGKFWNPLRNRLGLGKKGDAKQKAPGADQKTLVATIALSPSRGEQMIHIQIQKSPDTILFDGTITLRKKLLVLDSAISKVRCELAIQESHFVGNVEMKATLPDKDGHTSRFMFGGGIASDTSSRNVIRLTCDPAFVLNNCERSKDKLKLDDNRLVVDDHGIHCRFDSKSGRLLDCSGVLDFEWKADFKVEVAPGLYERVLKEHQFATADWKLMRIDESPFACIVALLAGNNGQMSADEAAASVKLLVGLADRWQKQEQASPLFAKRGDAVPGRIHESDFFIPMDSSPSDATAFIYEFAFGVLGDLVPKESSIWTILREFAFISMGESQHTEKVLTSIFESTECGPLANLVASDLFGMLNRDFQIRFAKRGLQHLATREFQVDYQPFLSEQILIGKAILSLGSLLQGCNDEEIGELVDLMSINEGPARDAVVRSLSQFPQHPDSKSKDVVAAALDEIWEPIIRPHVETLLTANRGPESWKKALRIGKK